MLWFETWIFFQIWVETRAGFNTPFPPLENLTLSLKHGKWGYEVNTNSDACISAINAFYHQVLIYGRERSVILEASIHDPNCVLTRTGGATRRRSKEEVEEEKNNVPVTPTMASSRTTAPVASTRRKTKIAKETIQMGSLAYSTWRSVRLAVEQLAELGLNGRGKTKPIQMGSLAYSTR